MAGGAPAKVLVRAARARVTVQNGRRTLCASGTNSVGDQATAQIADLPGSAITTAPKAPSRLARIPRQFVGVRTLGGES